MLKEFEEIMDLSLSKILYHVDGDNDDDSSDSDGDYDNHDDEDEYDNNNDDSIDYDE